MNDFSYHYEPGDANKKVILALHGTGGDEKDLIPLAADVAPGSPVLSPRGRILENGAPRFFKRLSEGVFDLEDLEIRTQELADWIVEMSQRHEFDLNNLYALGYSNGANIAASLLLRRPEVLAGGVLLRAMVPFEPSSLPDLSGKHILIGAGISDYMANEKHTASLLKMFKAAGADAHIASSLAGHNLVQQDIDAAKTWLAERG